MSLVRERNSFSLIVSPETVVGELWGSAAFHRRQHAPEPHSGRRDELCERTATERDAASGRAGDLSLQGLRGGQGGGPSASAMAHKKM